MMLFAGGGFYLAINQRIQRHMPDQSRARLRRDGEGLFVGREKLHAPDLLGMHLSLEINDLISSQDGIVVQAGAALLVMGSEFGKHLAFCDSRAQRLDVRLKIRDDLITSLSLRLCREHGN